MNERHIKELLTQYDCEVGKAVHLRIVGNIAPAERHQQRAREIRAKIITEASKESTANERRLERLVTELRAELEAK